MTFEESQRQLCSKLNIDFADIANNPVFTLSELREWINIGSQRAWDYRRWAFTEDAVFTTSTNQEYYDYPSRFVSDSIKILKVQQGDGKMKIYTKTLFSDYQKYLEEQPNGQDKIFSDYRRFYFINPNTFTTGRRIEIWGKRKAPILANDSDLLPFSPNTDNDENSGNMAIVLFAYAEALSSDKKKEINKAIIEERRAQNILDTIWERVLEEQVSYKSKDAPLFSVPDFLK